MPLTRSEVGLALAVFASLITLTFPAWPVIGPMAVGNTGAVWTLCVWLVASAFLAAAWFVEDHPVLGRAMLLAGSLVLTGVGLMSGRILAAWELHPVLGGLALVPELFGFIAACLIGPVQETGTGQATGEQGAKEPLQLRQEIQPDGDRENALPRAS